MKTLSNFLKGIVVGIGGIAPGLSGSVLLVIFGLYQKTVNAIGTLFKNFKKNILFLVPLFLGFGIGALLFSKIVDFMMTRAEFATRYLFLGLIIGTVPLFYKELKKEGFHPKYYINIACAFLIGLFIFYGNVFSFPDVTNPNLLQSVLMGISVAGSFIIPGVDSAAILSALGLYDLFYKSLSRLADFDLKVLTILIPAGVGLIIGALLISFIMNKLIKNFYTATFSIIFGLFLTVIPSVLNQSCVIVSLKSAIMAVVLIIFGFAISFYFGNIKENNKKIKKLFKK
ncbi:MAG: DUF368 domain-containing protein [Clostridia bacterium]|nr:DUF368 domain-containing protein [Clostridia bacterium]